MTFLQPSILLALPLVGLPVLIHLLNQRRHKPINWGAMLFIRQARRINRGFTTLRHWFILTLRMLAVAGLIFALSRPLASHLGGFSLGGGGRKQIILLDRSPSMEHSDPKTGKSRRETALERLRQMFHRTGQRSILTLIESTAKQPYLLDDAKSLPQLLETGATAAAADIPEMMANAIGYIETNSLGPTDIWICSDLQKADWNAESGRWPEIREKLATLPGIRCTLLAYPDQEDLNLAISVDNIERVVDQNRPELRFDLHVIQTGGSFERRNLPVTIDIEGLRSTIEIELVGGEFHREELSVSLGDDTAAGTGFVELPGDANLADNRYYFAFSKSPPLHSVVVSDDPTVSSLLQLAAETPASARPMHRCDVLPSARENEIEWGRAALILWHAALPTGPLANQLEEFVASGRTVIFFPVDESVPESASANNKSADSGQSFAKVSWGDWTGTALVGDEPDSSASNSTMRVDNWRTDADLLRNADSGEPLPMNKLVAWRWRATLAPKAAPLASFENGSPLLLRATTDRGGVYFCSTLPLETHSTLTSDGIALYVMIQRALEQSSQHVGQSLNLAAGRNVPRDIRDWISLNPQDHSVLLSEREFQPGIYEKEGRLAAINRPTSEDRLGVLSETDLGNIFGNASFQMIRARAGDPRSLASETWQLFIIVMIVTLIAEGVMSLPNRAAMKPSGNPFAKNHHLAAMPISSGFFSNTIERISS